MIARVSRGRKTFWACGLVMGSLLMMASPASAGTIDHNSAGDKLVRGLSNVFLGFLEVPRNIHNVSESRNSLLQGWTVGLGEGLGYTLLRMGAGVYEVVTFPFPLPEGYRPIVKPPFVWDAEGPDVTR